MSEDVRTRLTRNPGVRGGKPCIRGQRLTVYDVQGYVAEGLTTEEILGYFPFLTLEDIQACLDYTEDTPGLVVQSTLTPS
jgi:uncharacterized protein (DUF433 family)